MGSGPIDRLGGGRPGHERALVLQDPEARLQVATNPLPPSRRVSNRVVSEHVALCSPVSVDRYFSASPSARTGKFVVTLKLLMTWSVPFPEFSQSQRPVGVVVKPWLLTCIRRQPTTRSLPAVAFPLPDVLIRGVSQSQHHRVQAERLWSGSCFCAFLPTMCLQHSFPSSCDIQKCPQTSPDVIEGQDRPHVKTTDGE